jgi:hypothetical protein
LSERSTRAPSDKASDRLLVVAGSFLLGCLADFIFNGVFKIIWAAVYGPCYLVLAIFVGGGLDKTRFVEISRKAAVVFLVGSAFAHFLLSERHTILSFPMDVLNVEADQPVRLASKDWPQELVVQSPGLQTALVQGASKTAMPVTVEVTKTYGCVRSFRVSTVGGVDVKNDIKSSWTWRTNVDSHAPEAAFPEYVDRKWFWCQIQFYRDST